MEDTEKRIVCRECRDAIVLTDIKSLPEGWWVDPNNKYGIYCPKCAKEIKSIIREEQEYYAEIAKSFNLPNGGDSITIPASEFAVLLHATRQYCFMSEANEFAIWAVCKKYCEMFWKELL